MQLSTAYKKQLAKAARVLAAAAVVVSSAGSAVASQASAATLSTVSATITTSQPTTAAGMTISFIPGNASTAIEYVQFKLCTEAGTFTETCTPPGAGGFQVGLTEATSVTIGGTWGGGTSTLSDAEETSTNEFFVDLATPGAETNVAHTIILTSAAYVNPTTPGTYYLRFRTYSDAGTTDLDTGTALIAVVPVVTVSGRVLESMTFTVNGVVTSTACGSGGATTNVGTTSTGVPFGNFQTGTPRIGCLTVATATNADGGYTTKIKEVLGAATAGEGDMCRQTASNCSVSGGQNGIAAADALVNAGGLDSTAGAWVPSTDFGLGFGVIGSHKDVDFGTPQTYKSMHGASAINVSSFGDPTSAVTSAVSVTFIADSSPTQTAGQYQNQVMFITTPTF